MSTSNTAALTHSHAVYSAKKRAKKAQIQEVLFDDEARREYLTGFRKRNLLKKEAKRKNAKERERLERLELRKEHRRELAERAAQNVKEVEGALGALPVEAPFDSEVPNKPQEEELEFEDQEQLATVTVVEDFTVESLTHPPTTPPVLAQSEAQVPRRLGRKDASSKPDNTPKTKLKAKAKKFRYETKAGRKTERTKQRTRRTEKAERAGGKKKRGTKR